MAKLAPGARLHLVARLPSLARIRAKSLQGNGVGSGSRHRKGVPTRREGVGSPTRSNVMDADRDSNAP